MSDLERSRYFYTQALSFVFVSDITVEGQDYSALEDVAETRIRIVTLQLQDKFLTLMQYLNIEGKPIPQNSQSTDLWFQHFAIVVSDSVSFFAR